MIDTLDNGGSTTKFINFCWNQSCKRAAIWSPNPARDHKPEPDICF